MKKQLDIGCSGFTRAWEGFDCYGIDIVKHDDPKILQRDLVLETIPFEDDNFDLVTAYDFLEHVPFVLYFTAGFVKDEATGQAMPQIMRREVMIELFNEVYRVLKPNGEFYIQTPIYPDKTAFQDPQHLSFWTDDTLNYFSGDYFGFHDHYNNKSRFEQVKKEIINNHIYATLRAVKGLPDDAEYKLKY